MLPVKLEALSHDVLTRISQYCELGDLIPLSRTCPRFQKLSKKPEYWLIPLLKARYLDPIAYPLHKQLRGRTVDELKAIVHHTLRVREEWSPELARVEHGTVNLKWVSIEKDMDLLFQVPGTTYYLLHCKKTGNLIAFDAASKVPIRSSFKVRFSKQIGDVSAGQNEPGTFSMGLLATDEHYLRYQLAVVSLFYNDQGITQVSLTFSELPSDATYSGVFISNQMIGVLQVPNGELKTKKRMYNLLVHNLKTNQGVTITTDIKAEDPSLFNTGTWVVDDEVYLLVERKTASKALTTTYRFPKATLPNDYNSCSDSTFISSQNIHCTWKAPSMKNISTAATLTADTHYRVPCVSVHQTQRNKEPFVQVRFWTLADDEIPSNENQGDVNCNKPVRLLGPHIVNVPGRLPVPSDAQVVGVWQLLLLSQSGRYLLVVVEQPDDRNRNLYVSKMMLVGYDRRRRACTARELQMPPGFDPSTATGFSLDDHTGTVSLIMADGRLMVVTFM